MRIGTLLATAAGVLALTGGAALAACDDGETVIKFSHVTNTDKHPKGIAASLFVEPRQRRDERQACVEVYPNSTLYNDDQVLEAMLQGDVQFAAPSLSKFETFTKTVPDLRSAVHVQEHRGRGRSSTPKPARR